MAIECPLSYLCSQASLLTTGLLFLSNKCPAEMVGIGDGGIKSETKPVCEGEMHQEASVFGALPQKQAH